jgi:hypothetical protein
MKTGAVVGMAGRLALLLCPLILTIDDRGAGNNQAAPVFLGAVQIGVGALQEGLM